MHIVQQTVPPRRRPGHKRRLRDWGQHLRLLVVLPGRRRRHLACLDLPLWNGFPIPEVERCRARLVALNLVPEVVEELMVNITKRVETQRRKDERARARALNTSLARRLRQLPTGGSCNLRAPP